MNNTMAAVVGAATLLSGLVAASPALAVTGDGQLCSPSTNGGTMSNGVACCPPSTWARTPRSS